jgi:hypothetical protein
VLLADGSQSSVESRPFRFLAKRLNETGLATLLLDLLTTDEAANVTIAAQMRLNIELLANRFEAGTTWLKEHFKEDPLAVGYCTSAAASAGFDQADVAALNPSRLSRTISTRQHYCWITVTRDLRDALRGRRGIMLPPSRVRQVGYLKNGGGLFRPKSRFRLCLAARLLTQPRTYLVRGIDMLKFIE